MAIDDRLEVPMPSFNKPRTEEYEKSKKEAVGKITEHLLDGFAPEDRAEIFNDVRRNLNDALREHCCSMASEIEHKNNYFESLTKLVH
jgi:hypothetical protein